MKQLRNQPRLDPIHHRQLEHIHFDFVSRLKRDVWTFAATNKIIFHGRWGCCSTETLSVSGPLLTLCGVERADTALIIINSCLINWYKLFWCQVSWVVWISQSLWCHNGWIHTETWLVAETGKNKTVGFIYVREAWRSSCTISVEHSYWIGTLGHMSLDPNMQSCHQSNTVCLPRT